jgi:hypothetical protein
MGMTKTTVIAHNPFVAERRILQQPHYKADDIETADFFDQPSFKLRLRVAKIINAMAVVTWLLGVLLYFI